MTAAPASHAQTARPPTLDGPPERYVRVPQRLLNGAAYHALPVGVYALVARLYLIHQAPIALSAADLTRYDPALSRGAAQRALTSLVAGGYLIEQAQAGQKTRYTPAWGRVAGQPLPWTIGRPCLDRPRHVRAVCLDLRLLDLYLGKLTPHAQRAAIITRYVAQPLLGLADVGAYALLLGGLPAATPALRAWGLCAADRALPLPDDADVLAKASQQALSDDTAGLSARGLQRAGLSAPAPQEAIAPPAPLFFVPPDVIANLPTTRLASVIGQGDAAQTQDTAPERATTAQAQHAQPITWESPGSARTSQDSPPTPQTGGGGRVSDSLRVTGARPPAPELPATEAAQALSAIGVRSEQVIELADAPLAAVQQATQDGQARPYVRDLAGWVVSLLRARRDFGWTAPPPPVAADAPEALGAYFARLAAPDDAPATPEPPAAPERLLEDIWQDALAQLRLRVPREVYTACVRHARLRGIADGVATIAVADARVRDTVARQHVGVLRLALSDASGQSYATIRLV